MSVFLLPASIGSLAGAQAIRGGILDQFSNAAQFLSEEGKGLARYGFRTLPDILLSGSLFLTFMLGGSWPIGFFSLGIIFTGIIQGILGNLIRQNKPGFTKPGGSLGGADDPCSGHFPGVSWSRLLSVVGQDEAVEGAWPSYYMTIMGYVLGFIASQDFIFKDELSMRPATASSLRYFTIATAFLVVALGIIRLLSSNGKVCEPWASVVLSTAVGMLLAVIYVTIVTTVGGRNKINVLQLPLLEKRVPDEKPIYVCENPNN
jgi:hypothetical protein